MLLWLGLRPTGEAYHTQTPITEFKGSLHGGNGGEKKVVEGWEGMGKPKGGNRMELRCKKVGEERREEFLSTHF